MVPFPGADVTSNLPPRDSTRSRMDVSPRRRAAMARAAGSKPTPSSWTTIDTSASPMSMRTEALAANA